MQRIGIDSVKVTEEKKKTGQSTVKVTKAIDVTQHAPQKQMPKSSN